jgi:hypothetical protein
MSADQIGEWAFDRGNTNGVKASWEIDDKNFADFLVVHAAFPFPMLDNWSQAFFALL